jgi:transposase
VDKLGTQVHPVIQTLLPNKDAVLKDDNAPIHTAGTVHSWFEEHEGELQHFPWPAKSSDLNIIEPLWSVLKTRMRKRFPPPTSLKQLSVLQEEWYKIPLETLQYLYESIPRTTAAVFKAKGGPTPY